MRERGWTLLEKTVDGEADAAVEVQRVGGVLERESVAAALRTPVMERRVGARVLEISRDRAVDHNLHDTTSTRL